MSSVDQASVNEGAEPSPKSARRQKKAERDARRREVVVEHLTDPVVVPEDVLNLTDQANDIYLAFKPRNGWQDWLTSEIAVCMVRINRCSRLERRLRDLASFRAIDFWEDDQKLEVENLALKIHRLPGKTVAKLRLTPAGCDWLRARWQYLAKTAPGEWTDEQQALAKTLTGADLILDPAAEGFAAERVAELEQQKKRIEQADEIARDLVICDLTDDIPNLGKLRRYQHSLSKQMRYYIDQFYVEHPDRWDDPARKPAFLAHDLVHAENTRARSWKFADPKPPNGETKPLPVAEAAENPKPDGTKPLLPASTPQDYETKPLVADRPDRTRPDLPLGQVTVDMFRPDELTCVHPSNEKLRPIDVPRRTDHVRDANQRRKRQRRRESLAKLGV